jgi:hypothetical protein
MKTEKAAHGKNGKTASRSTNSSRVPGRSASSAGEKTGKSGNRHAVLSPGERHLLAEYRRAKRFGFSDEFPDQDWLEIGMEIDWMLNEKPQSSH